MGATKHTLAVSVIALLLLCYPGLSSADIAECKADDCAPAQLPILAPPITPDESHAIRDTFSWENTRPVPTFRGQNPTLYYALIYIEDESDLEALEDLQIHWDTVPLFADERDLWIEKTGDMTPVFDGEGGFVFAVIPGVTFNLLREAALCRDPEAVDEAFQVVQLREIPVPEARESDGSLSYEFLATEGFQYRGLPSCADSDPNDPETVCGPKSDARQLLLHDKPNVCVSGERDDGSNLGQADGAQVELPFGIGLGKKFKRLAGRAVRFVKGASDLARRGLARLERLFKGSVRLAITLETRNTDPGFGGRASTMQRTWGVNRNKPVPLSGVQVRIFQNLTYRLRFGIPSVKIPGTDFRTPGIIADTGTQNVPDIFNSLATGRANDDGFARIRVVKNARAKICVRLENQAARVLNWVLPQETCATERIAADQLNADAAFTARISDERLNILAQATEGRAYLQDVVQYRPKRAEVMVGFFSDLISQSDGLGDDRAFAPCFGFPNWDNPYAAILRTLGQLAGRQLGKEAIGPALRRGADLAAEAFDGFGMAAEKWAAARIAAAGTSASAAVDAAADAVNGAKDAALSAAQAAATAAQAGRDITEAAEQLLLAQRRGTRQSVIDAAGAALERAVPDANTAVVRATDAQAAAARAATDAAILVDAAVAAAGNTAAAATVLVAATASRAAASLVQATGEILARGVTIGLELVGLTAGQLIGEVVTDIFDTVLADVDLVIPSGPSRQSRGLVTHEYGHFVLCDMMYRTSPFKFGSAWTKTIADTIAKQALKLDRTNDENAFINEAFADFFAGQVAGGVNYFEPVGSESAFRDTPPEWHDPMNWCDANGMNRLRCIEDNFGAGMGHLIPGASAPDFKQVSGKSMTGNPIEDPFRDQVARIATILHDAFDGHPNNPAKNVPGNGAAWTFNGGLIAPRQFEESVTPIDSLDQPGMLHEESITLTGSGLFRTIQEWFDQEPPLAHLRERTFLGGLTRVMRMAGFSHDEICRLYILHQPNDICPAPPVGPPGNADLEPVSPPGSTRFCDRFIQVVVRVRNATGVSAPASTTKVDFFSVGSVDVPTSGIPSGGFVDLSPIQPPPGCNFNRCEFRVTVDSGNSVDEGTTGEANNSADGVCIGIE